MFLIASKTRSSFPSFATHLAVTTYAMSFPFLPHAVPQDADALDLELDHVSGPQPAVQLQARAARCGSGSEHVTRVERLGHRRVGDQVAEAVVHVRRRVLAPGLAVDAGCHPEVVCCELVGCDDAWPEHVRAVPILRLRRSHPDRQLPCLHVSRRHVVPDRPPEHVPKRLGGGDVSARRPDDRRELELVIELLGVAGPGDVLIRTDHRVGQTLVVDRNGEPLLRDRPAEAGEGVLHVTTKGEEVAQAARPERREQAGAFDVATFGDRGAGLDEGDHVAPEAEIDDGSVLERSHAWALSRLVGDEPHCVAVRPPSSVKSCPVTNADASEQKNRTTPTRSSVSPILPSGIRISSPERKASSASRSSTCGVRTKVGAMAFTVIPYLAHSVAC